jgi:hypothetical protein
MSAVLPIIAWCLPIVSSFKSGVRICTGRAFYALQRLKVFPETAMLCLILLQAGARFHKRPMGSAVSRDRAEIPREVANPLKELASVPSWAPCANDPASGIMIPEARFAVSLKNPDAVASIVEALRHVYGDEVARLMLVEGMSLANLIEAMFAAPLTHREAIRAMTDGLDDFVISPDLGLIWHLRYLYADQPGSLHVVDLEIATPDGTLASKDVWLRLSA